MLWDIVKVMEDLILIMYFKLVDYKYGVKFKLSLLNKMSMLDMKCCVVVIMDFILRI